MLGITGGTGGLGSAIVNRIVDKSLIPASQVVVLTRDPSSDTAKALSSKGVNVRKFDYGDASSLPTAFAGLDSLLIMPPGPSAGPNGTRYQVEAIDAAKSAGVKKIYLISNVSSKAVTTFEPAIIHHEVEQHLEKQGWDFVSIRNALYMHVIDVFVGGAVEFGAIAAPPDGKINWVEREELGQAAAHIITGAYPIKEKYIDLVAPQAYDFAEVAQILSKVSGKTITRKEVTAKELQEGFTAKGFPEPVAEIFTSIPVQAREGDFGQTNGILDEVLGGKYKTVEAYLKEKYGQKA